MIRSAVLFAWPLAALAAGAALADPRPTSPPIGVATQCLDTLGGQRAPFCRSGNASRIAVDPDICSCPAGTRTVSLPYCAVGEAPPPQSARADRARLAAVRGGSLDGAGFEGRRFCQPRGRTGDAPG